MLKDKIAGIIESIRLIEGVKLCALISRDGILLGRYSASDFNEAWFAAMCATLLASAESAAVIVKVQSPEMVTIHSPDGILIIMGAGEKILIAALVDPAWDMIQMTGMLKEVAEDVGGTF
ncbi:roadblock/LC7 domain-containing protein [Methanospirillum sp.]|uniref:roadblock/LC7 domain-containing protein n=1 Tax=Methanospirillum sp. TaxID=45200 RepID=UPI002985D325|nr:roadblock/LC7 domain-containing protein [Methanospirillum sp.]